MKSLVFIFLLAVGCGVAEGLMREYIYNSTTLNWADAQSSCREYYRDLATITNMKENTRLLQSGSDHLGSWIGLKRSSGNWTWSDNEQSSFDNWCTGFPLYSGNCAKTIIDSIGIDTKLWMNFDCTTYNSFYCYHFLILVKEKKTWDEAQEFCRTNYTGLASVTSKTSLQQLTLETEETQTENVWTGLRFMNRQWFWVSGEPMGSLASVGSLPQCPALRCGALNNQTNSLIIHNCNDRLNFICYWA